MTKTEKYRPKLAPEAKITVNTTNLIIAMTSGLVGEDFFSLAKLIIGESKWREPEPRPCFAVWHSLAKDAEIRGLIEKMTGAYIYGIIEDQHRDVAGLIKEIKKYVKPFNKWSFPRLPESQYKFWTDANGNFCHNVAIVNKKDELVSKIDPIRKRVGFPETITFSENDKTRERFDWTMRHFEVADSIVAIDATPLPPEPEPKDAIPRIEDKSLENMVARAFTGRAI